MKRSEGCDQSHKTRISAGSLTSGPEYLQNGIQETGNDHSEDLHNRKMKLSNDSNQCGEERKDQEENGSALYPTM